MELVSCPGCSRHVRTSETACPFCGASITPVATPTARITGTRAAMLFGAGAVAIACGGAEQAPVAIYGAPAPSNPVYVAPPTAPTSSAASPKAPAAPDAGAKPAPPSPPVAMYGAPSP